MLLGQQEEESCNQLEIVFFCWIWWYFTFIKMEFPLKKSADISWNLLEIPFQERAATLAKTIPFYQNLYIAFLLNFV